MNWLLSIEPADTPIEAKHDLSFYLIKLLRTKKYIKDYRRVDLSYSHET